MRIGKTASFFLIFSLAALDQAAKYIIRWKGGFYICNPHAAWGMRIDTDFFWIGWLVVMLFVFLKILRHPEWPWLLIFSGALGNFLDRMIRGCVIDFIDLKIWPVFNPADLLIFSGSLWILINFLKKRR